MKIIDTGNDFVDLRFTKQEYEDFLKTISFEENVMLSLIGYDPRKECVGLESANLKEGVRVECKAKTLQTTN